MFIIILLTTAIMISFSIMFVAISSPNVLLNNHMWFTPRLQFCEIILLRSIHKHSLISPCSCTLKPTNSISLISHWRVQITKFYRKLYGHHHFTETNLIMNVISAELIHSTWTRVERQKKGSYCTTAVVVMHNIRNASTLRTFQVKGFAIQNRHIVNFTS